MTEGVSGDGSARDPHAVGLATRPIPRLASGGAVTIRPPGSKSITNRLLLLAALSSGMTTLRHPLRSDDTDRLLAALVTLGVRAREVDDGIEVHGVDGVLPHGGSVDLGDGGTPTRLMLAAASLAQEPVVIDGSRRMRERPVAEGAALLRAIGGAVEWVGAPERLPIRVLPVRPRGGRVDVPTTSSSQFISALMLIAPWLEAGIDLRFAGPVTSAAYLDLTTVALRHFGARVQSEAGRIRVEPGMAACTSMLIEVEADASSAAYWIAAGAMVAGAQVRVAGLTADSIQPDVGILEVIEQMGGSWRAEPDSIIVDTQRRLRGVEIDLSHMPDGAMMVAGLAAVAEGPSRLTGLRTLRVKETDRLLALRTELCRVGARTACGEDWLSIEPIPMEDLARGDAERVVVATYGDHRMAMCMAILGLVRGGISIADPACVDKSYPGFWEDLDRFVAAGTCAPTADDQTNGD